MIPIIMLNLLTVYYPNSKFSSPSRNDSVTQQVTRSSLRHYHGDYPQQEEAPSHYQA